MCELEARSGSACALRRTAGTCGGACHVSSTARSLAAAASYAPLLAGAVRTALSSRRSAMKAPATGGREQPGHIDLTPEGGRSPF